MKLYLSGPISGHDRQEIETWRDIVRNELADTIDILDPAAAHYDASLDHLQKESPTKAKRRQEHGRFVIERNKALIAQSDLVLVNFLEAAGHVSIGSIAEVFLANALNKPVVLIRKTVGDPHDHAMLNAAAAKICNSLEDGIEAVRQMLGASNRILRSA